MHNEEENIRKQVGNKKPQSGFQLPDNYFNTFSSKVKESIEVKTTRPKGFAWGGLLRPVYSVPFVAVVLLVAGYFSFFNPATTHIEAKTTAKTITTDDISIEAIEEYLAQGIDLIGVDSDIEEDFILLALTPNEVLETNTTTKIVLPLLNTKDTIIELTDKEIEDYLFDNIDEDLLEDI